MQINRVNYSSFLALTICLISRCSYCDYFPQPLILVHGWTGYAKQWTDSNFKPTLESYGIPVKAYGFVDGEGAVESWGHELGDPNYSNNWISMAKHEYLIRTH